MRAKILVSLNPFPVPETVTLAPTVRAAKVPPWAKGKEPAGAPPAPYWEVPLADLDAETLHRLCEEFRDTVFFKADKPQPPEPSPPLVDTAPAFRALDKLRAVLCDPEGAVCVTGEDEDREAVAGALDTLNLFVTRL